VTYLLEYAVNKCFHIWAVLNPEVMLSLEILLDTYLGSWSQFLDYILAILA
jgi:hypothetical protein